MSRWLGVSLLALVCAFPALTRADPPSGSFALEFSRQSAIWGGAWLTTDDCSEEDPCLSIETLVDPAGRLSGEVAFTGTVESNGVTGVSESHGPVKGRARGKDGRAKLKLSSRLEGFITSPYTSIPLNGKLIWNVEPDGVLGIATSESSFVLCGLGCGRSRSGKQATALLPEDGGPWQLAIELETDSSNRVSGVAIATFDDGSEPIEFEATGRYDAKKDVSNVKLASTVPGPGATLKLTRLETNDVFVRGFTSYSIRGQSGKLLFSVAR